MQRVIFDTNIYGLLMKEENIGLIREKILNDKNFVLYGFQPIRKELRDTPKYERLRGLNKRNLILGLYDELTKGRYLKDSIQININQIASMFSEIIAMLFLRKNTCQNCDSPHLF